MATQRKDDTTNAEARRIFDQAIAKLDDPDAIARLELAREYFTNPAFKKWLEDTVWEANR